MLKSLRRTISSPYILLVLNNAKVNAETNLHFRFLINLRQFHFDNNKDVLPEPEDATSFNVLSPEEVDSSKTNKYQRREEITELLRTKYRFSADKINKLFASQKFTSSGAKNFSSIIDIVNANKISSTTLKEHLWIFSENPTILQEKINILKKMTIYDLNDFVPFLQLSVPRLRKMVNMSTKDTIVPSRNRVYFISSRLGLNPPEVSKYLVRRLFTMEMDFNMLRENLAVLLKYGVKPENILKDLWVFRYAPECIKARLERAKLANKDKIMPWMVRCSERILERSLHLAMEEKSILGEDTLVEFVSKKLGYSPEITQSIMEKHPAVFNVRVVKIKEILDYLIDEAGFTTVEVAQCPRILCHGLETTKKRINELASHGCRPNSLIILCKSKREYDKFLKNWINRVEKTKRFENINS